MTLVDTHLVINEEGNIVQEYRKLHLYDVDLSLKVSRLQCTCREE